MAKPVSKVVGIAVCLMTLGTLAALQQAPDTAEKGRGPIAHWVFDKAKLSGTSVPDQAGKLTGTLMGSPVFFEDKATFGVQFSAAEHGIMIQEKVPANAEFLPKESITISAWARIDEGIEYGGILSCVQDNGDAESGLLLGYDHNTFMFALASKGTDDGNGKITYLRAKTRFEKGKWYHVAGTYDGKTMQIHVNGKAEASSNEQSGAILYAKSAPLVIGRYRDDNEDFPMKGAVREVAIYDRCLTDQDIAAQFQKNIAISQAPLSSSVLGFVISPYLQFPTQDSIVIMWETNHPSTSVVNYGKQAVGMQKVENTELVTMHEVKIPNLEQGTRYIYNVMSTTPDGLTLTSQNSAFMTAIGPDDAFSFTVIGDTQANPIITGKIAKLMWDRRPNFVVHCGDVVDDGGSKRMWTDELFKPSAELFGHVAVFPTIGNHEKNHPHYYKYFSLPKPEYYYRYRYGNIDFFSIDTNKIVKPGSEQYTWLDQELAKSDATFKICYHHHPAYSSDSDDYGKTNAGPGRMGDLNARELVALYEKHNVDIVMNGHIHLYERSWPIRANKVDRQKGVIYLTSGGGGGRLEDFAPTPTWFKAECRVDFHFCCFTVHQNKMNFKAFDQDGKLFDYFELTK